jgi:hypothetical protein
MIGSVLLVYGISFVVFVAGVVFLYEVRNMREAAETRAGELDWIYELLKRASEQIQSADEDSILAGLQVIAQYKSPEYRAKLFSRIEVLTGDQLPTVARQARWTRDAIVRQSIFVNAKPKAKDATSGLGKSGGI